MTAIRAERVSKSYRRYGRKRTVGSIKSALLSGLGLRALSADQVFSALDDVTFEIAAGETVGIIGENGSGKSTLLKLLAKILAPTSGRVETRGRVSALIELGAGFHPEISARENIEINGMLLGLSKKQVAARMDSILAFAGVSEFLDAPVKTFSSGMVVRLGFAVAAHSDPDVLLVDEVLAVGDEEFSHRCLEKIAEFQKQGRTIVVVSHDLDLIATHCRRVLRLSGGRLAASGPPAEVVGKYREQVADREGRARLLSRRAESSERWGSGEAIIEDAWLLGPGREPVGVLRAGEPFAVQFRGRANGTLEDLVAGVQISKIDGTVVFGSNTLIDRYDPGAVSGSFSATLRFESADLAAGAYSLDVAVHRRDGAPYDYRSGIVRFDVFAPEATAGVWRPIRAWKIEPGENGR
ncbi:MAG: ABC transporter ATP-binding protein [Thermoanaerobaculia bacterium]